MTTFPDLARIAENLGVRLTRHNGGVKGFYNHRVRTISTRRGLSAAAYRCTLAHELAHAHYGDIPTGNGHFDQRQEARADRYAARLLINPHSFDVAYRWCQGNLQELAEELEITHHLLEIYLEHHSTEPQLGNNHEP